MITAMTAAVAVVALVLGVGWLVRPRPLRRALPTEARQDRRRSARRTRSRRRRRSATAFADHLAAIAREVRGGGTVTAAFIAVEPDQPDLDMLRPAHRLVADGMPLGEALHTTCAGRTARRDGLDVVVHTLSCAATVGGAAAVAIDAAASVLREREAVAADARAHSAQARLSGRVLTVVPLAFASWSVATDGRIRRTYTSTSIGASCVVAGLALNLLGWWWMRRIVATGGGR